MNVFAERGSGKPVRAQQEGTGAGRKPTRLELLAAGAVALGAAHDARAQEPVDLDVAGIEETYEEGEAELKQYGCDGEIALFDPNSGRVNWMRVLEPGYGVVEREQGVAQRVEFAVPYKWSRAFDSGIPVDEGYQEQVRAYIQKQIQEQLFDNLHGLGWDKKDFLARNGLKENQALTVHSITIEGLTSPEARTVEGISQDAVDPENLDLGRLRAEDAMLRLQEVFTSMGVEVDKSVLENISSDELQFSDEEMNAMEAMARTRKTGIYEDVIFELIEDYNNNRIQDAATVSELDEIISSKRMVNIAVEFNEVEKDRWIIPGLWPLLLPLFLRRFRRNPRNPQIVGEPHGHTNDSLVDVVPPQRKNPEQYVHDVAIDVIQNFAFYQPIVDRYIQEEDPNLNDMIHSVLEAWTRNDNELRRAVHQEPINHRDDPRQVFYANLHARALRRMILDAHAAGPHTPASVVWSQPDTRQRIAQEIMEEVHRAGRNEHAFTNRNNAG